MREAIKKITEYCPPDFNIISANIILLTGRIDDLVAISPRLDPLPIADALDYIYRNSASCFVVYSPMKGLRVINQVDDDDSACLIKEDFPSVEEDPLAVEQIIKATMNRKLSEQRSAGKASLAVGRCVNQPDSALIELFKMLQCKQKVFVYFEYIPGMHLHGSDNSGHILSLLNELPSVCEQNRNVVLFAGKVPSPELNSVYPEMTQKIAKIALGGPTRGEIRTVIMREEYKQHRQLVLDDIFENVVDVMFHNTKSPVNGLKTIKDNWICAPNAVFNNDWIKGNGAPVLDLEKLDLQRFRLLLDKKLIGQDKAKSRVLERIENIQSFGKHAKAGPILKLLFAGPSGVGKTELAKIINHFLVDNDKAMLRINCETFAQSHEIAKLLGAPPGYEGHKEPGLLESHLSLHPFGSVVLDEFEKAHVDIRQAMLGLLEEGVIMSRRTNETLDFSQYVIIATTNAGKKEVDERDDLPFDKIDQDKREELYEKALGFYFSTELLGRFDDVLIFEFLSKKQMREVAELYLKKHLEEIISQYKLTRGTSPPEVAAEDDFFEMLLDNINPKKGARNIEKIVGNAVKTFWRKEILGMREPFLRKIAISPNYIINVS